MDDGDRHFVFKRPSENPLRYRGNLVDAFGMVVEHTEDADLYRLVRALNALERNVPMVYRSLLGQTLLNDIIHSVKDEYELREKRILGRRA